MSLKRFGPNDLVYGTLATYPDYNFIIHSGTVYRDNEILPAGNFSNKIKHISDGEISLHELNINRPSGSMIHGFVNKNTTRYAYKTISTSTFDDASQFQYGATMTQSYPMKAGLSRIFVDSGIEVDQQNFQNIGSAVFAANNKKYIRSLRNLIDSGESFGKKIEYKNLGTKKVNMICIPGIFYGSKVDKGSLQLNYYITGTLVARLEDKQSDGVLVETIGPSAGQEAGYALYNQGIMILTGSWDLSSGNHVENYFSKAATTAPSWLSFGTGIPLVGDAIEYGPNLSSSYEVKFRGTNKIPTLTMMAFSKKNEQNYSTNPTFLEKTTREVKTTETMYLEPERKIKNITNSGFENYSASFDNTTFITKVGIYDEHKNLIAIATLANPIKKTLQREYMIKMRMDF